MFVTLTQAQPEGAFIYELDECWYLRARDQEFARIALALSPVVEYWQHR